MVDRYILVEMAAVPRTARMEVDTTPGSGINEVRIAYVLKKEDLTRALFVLQKALEVYPGRTE